MNSSDLLMMVIQIADFSGPSMNFSFDVQQHQYRILQKVADNMNEARASDIIRRDNTLQKLIKNFNQHASRFQPTISNLITKVVNTGKRSLDVRSLFTLTQNLGIPALQALQDLAIKALLELSENKEEEQKNHNKPTTLRHVDNEFENFVPHLIEMCKN